MTDFDLNKLPKPEVDCSVCFKPVDIEKPRGYAKLQCGHEFHLDCIGATFNIRGFMICPNCRDQERSDWLFSVYTGDPRRDVDLVNWISDHHPFFVVPDGYHLCPGRGFVGADNVPVKGHIIFGMSSQDDFEVQMSSPRIQVTAERRPVVTVSEYGQPISFSHHRQVIMQALAERANNLALNPNDQGEGYNTSESDDEEGSFSVNGSSNATENDHQTISSSSSNGQQEYQIDLDGEINPPDEHIVQRDYLTAIRRVYGSTHLPTFICATCAARNPSTANTSFSGHTASASSTQRLTIFNTTLTDPQPSVMPSARGTQVPYDFNQAGDTSSPFAPAVRRALAELAPPDGSPIITSNENSHLYLTGVPIYNPQDDQDIPLPNHPPAPHQGNGPQ